MGSDVRIRSFLKVKMAAYFSVMVLLISIISVAFFYKNGAVYGYFHAGVHREAHAGTDRGMHKSVRN